jgi:mitotic spindle assembly checkpoint protein MAD2
MIICKININLIIFWYKIGVFDVLAYTDQDVVAPFTWIESDPKLISNPQMVKLHSFDTKVRK